MFTEQMSVIYMQYLNNEFHDLWSIKGYFPLQALSLDSSFHLAYN